MPDTSIHLKLLIGPTVPEPAPFEVADALISVEVTNRDSGLDGFQMTFSLGRESSGDYSLLRNNYFEPPARVILIVLMGVLPQVLIDGIITDHQFAPSNLPGASILVVTGGDISLRLNLEEKNKTFKNQSDSEIVKTILQDYGTYGLKPEVTTTDTRRQENQGITTQQDTDLAFIQKLATRNGFVFYVEPTVMPKKTTAHWGPQNEQRPTQPALNMNLGLDTNLESLSFNFDALGPATPQISVLDQKSKLATPISVPNQLRVALASRPAVSLRKTIPRDTANKDAAQAGVQALSLTSTATDAVDGSGELDAVRYGRVLRARQLVDVRGMGKSYDGRYYVKEVKHRLKRGEYKQSFSLKREGLGALSPMVVT